MSRVEDMTCGEDLRSEGDEPLKEVYLVVRPEEKYDLERALQAIMAPVYTTMSGLGRGTRRELLTGLTAGRGPLRWLRGPELAVLLPKTIFHLVIPESQVDAVIEAAGGVVRMKGGPGDCGLGVAFVGDVEGDIAIGEVERAGKRTSTDEHGRTQNMARTAIWTERKAGTRTEARAETTRTEARAETGEGARVYRAGEPENWHHEGPP